MVKLIWIFLTAILGNLAHAQIPNVVKSVLKAVNYNRQQLPYNTTTYINYTLEVDAIGTIDTFN